MARPTTAPISAATTAIGAAMSRQITPSSAKSAMAPPVSATASSAVMIESASGRGAGRLVSRPIIVPIISGVAKNSSSP